MKSSTTVSAVFFTALVAAGPMHDHAQFHHRRAYQTNILTVTEVETAYEVKTIDGALPPGAQAYSPEEIAQLTKNAGQPPKATNTNAAPVLPTVAPPPVNPAEVAPPPSSSSSSTAAPSPPPAPAAPVAPAPPPPPPAPPAASSAPQAAAPAPTGGAGNANPFFPNGPKVGETAQNVRLSPFLTYWTGATIENHIGACGHTPYLDTDPQLAKSDSKGDKKFMLHPPVISGNVYTDILQYCGAILEVTGPDGSTTTGTVVDLCEDCGGPGGIDMMKASWADVSKGVQNGDCVYGAKWSLSGWIKLLPAL